MYQTSLTTKGSYNTLHWFAEILQSNKISFFNRRVVDCGCAQGVMSYLALQNGAQNVTGIDVDPNRIDEAKKVYSLLGLDFICSDIKDTDVVCDISLLSMIIHWVGANVVRQIVRRTREKVVVIYRLPHPDYKLGLWYPEPTQLDAFMYSNRFQLEYSKPILQDQSEGKFISLAIYKRTARIDREGDVVWKHNISLGDVWLDKLNTIRQAVPLPSLIEAGIGYYKSQFINGHDLALCLPFKPHHDSELPAPPGLKQYLEELEEGFRKTGLMFADVTRHNIMTSANHFYLIDLDEIVPYDPNNNTWVEIKQWAEGVN